MVGLFFGKDGSGEGSLLEGILDVKMVQLIFGSLHLKMRVFCD